MTKLGRLAFVLLSLMCLAAAESRISQQAPPPRVNSAAQLGTAQLGGVVISTDGSEQPIRRAIVRVTAPELRGGREIATDDRGRFLFSELPAGRYQISASKPGYVMALYGQARPQGAGTTVSLVDGQKELSLRVPMPKGAVVSGRVTDEFGQPIAQARMSISQRAMVNGQAVLTFMNPNGAVTDDRGAYRIFGLAAGTYLVSVADFRAVREPVRPTTTADLQWATGQAATVNSAGHYSSAPPAGEAVAYSPIFHPSAARASDATPVEIEGGAERAGIDIAVRFVPVVRVSGTVTMPDGTPASGATTILVDEAAGDESGGAMPNSRTSATGEFTFSSAQSGQYRVMVQASSRAAGGRGGGPLDLWGMTTVNVAGRDVSGIGVVLQPGMTVSGRIVIDPVSTTKAPDLTTTGIRLGSAQRTGASFGVAPATIGPDGSFTMTGAAPGSYRLTVVPPLSPNIMGAPYTWVTKSVTLNGREVLERPFDIGAGENLDGIVVTLTDRVTQLSGRLIDAQDKPALDYFVIVMPVDRAFWVEALLASPRVARPASDGSFRFNALPPGEYYIGATTDYQPRDLSDAAFLAQLIPTAVKLVIADGEKKTRDLKIK